ncbi:MAG: hypothetical protein QXG10_04040 [Candidatus Hadarchaeales archaeon]
MSERGETMTMCSECGRDVEEENKVKCRECGRVYCEECASNEDSMNEFGVCPDCEEKWESDEEEEG